MLANNFNESIIEISKEFNSSLFISPQNQNYDSPSDSCLTYVHDKLTGDDRLIINLDSLSKSLVPRDYQTEALEKILNSNSILVLETGTGKTLVAQMLIEYTFRQYNLLPSSEAKAELSKKIKRPIFFLCNTCFLVEQQSAFLKENSERTIKTYNSSGSQSKLGIYEWNCIWDTYDVHVMTGQLLLNVLRSGFLELSRILLIIFDECHHSRKDEPYNRIMKEFYFLANKDERPQIFGMTASTSNASENIESSINRIETSLDSSLVSVDLSSNVVKSNKTINYSFLNYSFYSVTDTPPVYRYVVQSLIKFERFRAVVGTIDFILNEIGSYPCEKLIFNIIIFLKKATEPLDLKSNGFNMSQSNPIPLDSLLKNSKEFDYEFISKIKDVYKHLSVLPEFILAEESIKDVSNHVNNNLFSNLSSLYLSESFKFLNKCTCQKNRIKYTEIKSKLAPKVITILDYLLENKNKFTYDETNPSTQFRAIIFAQRRSSVYSISHLLSELEEFDFIRCEPFHGTNSKFNLILNAFCYSKTLKTRVSNTDQNDVLIKFKSGALNVLISTQVTEEGLDISDCNLIIRFDPALTLVQFIQSRGRARKSESEYVMLVTDSHQNRDLKDLYPYISLDNSSRDLSVHRNSDYYKKFMTMEDVMLKFCIAPKEIRRKNHGLVSLTDQNSHVPGRLTYSISVDELNFEIIKTDHCKYVESDILIKESVKENLDKLTCELFSALRKVSISEVFFDVIETRAKLTALSSISIIFQYAQTLFSTNGDFVPPTFLYTMYSITETRATITFPPNSPIKKIVGPISGNKKLSKRAACFYSVLVLFHYGLLTRRLLPMKRVNGI
ncbi:Dicer-like protein 1 [Smittium culicis]|uniref:Dicer-like protein 1 n=1 Tax=Smittium culicis TaxID=133412 RepID=A0A1R1XKF8_9FUNG|nr:Dicer-like protein 1 [Smittium culicis]